MKKDIDYDLEELFEFSRSRSRSALYEDAVVDKKLSFPAKLLPLLSEKDNSVICPYGIATVLAMVSEGACVASLQEILAALGFDSLEDLRQSVLATQDVRCEAFRSVNSLELMQGKEKVELLKAFKDKMAEYYHASIEEQESSEEAKLQLKNVADFKAEWLHKMERDSSGKRTFSNVDGSVAHPAFLSSTDEYRRYYNGRSSFDRDDVKAVAIPYKVNNERIPFEMILVDSDKPLTAGSLQHIIANMRPRKCKVEFPEFSIENKLQLIPMMQSLGLRNIFNELFPAFDGIATKILYASDFTQEAKIEVDKNGTIAKAVTSMTLMCYKSLPDAAESLVFNKPFHYFVRNTCTGEILFMGKVNKL